jgi:beta-galactosidase/beta-glucuronidase
MKTHRLLAYWLLLVTVAPQLAQAEWKPAKGPLLTRWTKDVQPDKVHPEYPRPQMVRKDWLNLNGLWDYAIRPRKEGRPEKFSPDGQILVPFPVESALSGVMKQVGPDKRLWYRRTFTAPEKWSRDAGHVLLHFGAVDWETEVWINGQKVGEHRGGYDPFTFEIDKALKKEGPQEIVVAVWDPSDAGPQPRGKQVRKPNSIWYTPTTGIWQTVWLEPVPKAYIHGLKIVPDIDNKAVHVTVSASGKGGDVIVHSADANAKGRSGEEVVLKIPSLRLWTPDDPSLTPLTIDLLSDGKRIDSVHSYVGMRKVSLGKDSKGVMRILLNNKPLFQYGPLDQGFWPDGLYTAPTDEALRYDIEMTKKLGCNLARKHVKVEPARWYYWCDKLGLLVWQDMPSGDAHVAPGKGEIKRSQESAAIYERELKAMIDNLHNHPCIVVWVPFNEGWGQYDTKRIADAVKKQDPSRLVICASGWNDVAGAGDIHDIHVYPGPGMPPTEPNRAVVLGEFGGLGLPLRGHTWQDEKNWGYRNFKTPAELTNAYVQLVTALRPLIGKGLSAAVYTQTTDVEVEVNGLMTYDRALVKMDAKKITEANRKLYLPPPVLQTVVPTSKRKAQQWRYTTTKPAEDWTQPGFDDSSWKKGRGGFGTPGTPGAVVWTRWDTADIWIRRTFDLPDKVPAGLHWQLHHDEDVEVFLNGKLVLKRTGYLTEYMLVPLSEEALKAVRPGRNTLAVHCHQTTGGQFIDVGLASLREVTDK